MKDYISKMNNIAPLLEFLGGSRWGNLCKEGSKYNSCISKTQNGILLQEVKQQYFILHNNIYPIGSFSIQLLQLSMLLILFLEKMGIQNVLLFICSKK